VPPRAAPAGKAAPARVPPPWPLAPMLAKPGPMPRGEGWAFEFKWDGYRTLVLCQGGTAQALSRNGRDVTAEFPELQGVAEAVACDAILDGEVVVLDARGRPDFQALQNRAGFGPVRSSKGQERKAVTFLAFDLLWLEGQSLLAQPQATRRAALEFLGLEGEGVWVPPASDDGEVLEKAARKLGLEGVVAKRTAAPYEPGKRTGAWVKVKHVHEDEFVVGGWTPGLGGRGATFGALLVGQHARDGTLRYAGSVGTGFTEAMLRDYQQRLGPLRTAHSPFAPDPEIPREAVFVEPRLVVRVKYASWTRDAHLRHPSHVGLRHDKDPREVVRQEG
jgi:bifunctional non-homologous end joining protein LigD